MFVTSHDQAVTFLCISIYSLTDVPTVSCSEMIDSFTKLLDEADEFDSIHDIVLQVKCLYIMEYMVGNFVSL